jgi:hypothetical protein
VTGRAAAEEFVPPLADCLFVACERIAARGMAKSRTSRAADVSNAPGVEEARNPLVLMKMAKSATRIKAAIAADVTVRLLIGLSPQQPATRSLSLVLRG